MNNFVVMALLIKDPELRYAANDQTPIAEFVIEFPGSKPDDPVSGIKAVAFGNLANDVAENYKSGDRVIIEGRLSMITIDRPEGFKEKIAEMTASRVHQLAPVETVAVEPKPATESKPVAEKKKSSIDTSIYATSAHKGEKLHQEREATKAAPQKAAAVQDLDDIPF